jgi:hypothetical protein
MPQAGIATLNLHYMIIYHVENGKRMTEVWLSMSDREKQIVAALLSRDFAGCEALRVQLETADVSTIDAEGSLRFKVSGPPALVDGRVPTEGYYFDRGVDHRPAVNLLLHVVEGKLHELEVYKDDGSPIEIPIYELELDRLHLS